jgi:hypothetical protein
MTGESNDPICGSLTQIAGQLVMRSTEKVLKLLA